MVRTLPRCSIPILALPLRMRLHSAHYVVSEMGFAHSLLTAARVLRNWNRRAQFNSSTDGGGDRIRLLFVERIIRVAMGVEGIERIAIVGIQRQPELDTLWQIGIR
jgi:hypothetical protein